MLLFLSLPLVAIFAALGLIHFHWALGGSYGYAVAIPTNAEGQRVLNPGKRDCVVVGTGLLAFSGYYLLKSGVVTLGLPSGMFAFGGWIIPAIFILRAIGDFKYVGFFKKVKGTAFAQKDTQLFSPLCMAMGLLGLAIQLWY